MTSYDRALGIIDRCYTDGHDVKVNSDWLMLQIQTAINDACDDHEYNIRERIAKTIASRLGVFE